MPDFHKISNNQISLYEWDKKHSSHKREHKIFWLGEHSLSGKIYYRALICYDCNAIIFFDRIESDENLSNEKMEF
jgi:hypothetical protein